MTAATVQVIVHPEVVAELARSAVLRDQLAEIVGGFAAELRSEAPVRTGAGRRSIDSGTEMTAEGWAGWAGWDPQHYYMGIQNSRTRWAEPTLRRVRYV